MKRSHNGKQINLLKFLKNKKFSVEEKLNTFTSEQPELERIQRKFAVACAWLAAERENKIELYEFIGLIQTMYESANWLDIENLEDDEYSAADRAADSAADRAAYWAAYEAAYWAEREWQKSRLLEMIEEYAAYRQRLVAVIDRIGKVVEVAVAAWVWEGEEAVFLELGLK